VKPGRRLCHILQLATCVFEGLSPKDIDEIVRELLDRLRDGPIRVYAVDL